jgi:hypothetical protein
MPCVTLLLQTQHTHLLETALALAHAGDAEGQPQDLQAFRALLIRHDRMERNVFQRLGAPATARGLAHAFDRALAGRPGADAVAVAAIARDFGQIIEDHANLQESELFPDLIERHDDSIRHKLGDHYARLPVHGTGLAMTGPVAA